MKVKEVAEAIGWAPSDWEGNCYAVSLDILAKGLVPGGMDRYGHWLGPVKEGTMFAGRPLVRHGWIEMPDGSVVDPTRWVFEGVEPYIYEGPNDYYDAGNVWRKLNLSAAPKRTYAKDEMAFELNLPDEVEDWLPGAPALKNYDQCFWLANLPLDMLGNHAENVYRALLKAKLGALIPFDNRKLVLKGD